MGCPGIDQNHCPALQPKSCLLMNMTRSSRISNLEWISFEEKKTRQFPPLGGMSLPTCTLQKFQLDMLKECPRRKQLIVNTMPRELEPGVVQEKKTVKAEENLLFFQVKRSLSKLNPLEGHKILQLQCGKQAYAPIVWNFHSKKCLPWQCTYMYLPYQKQCGIPSNSIDWIYHTDLPTVFHQTFLRMMGCHVCWD